MGARAGLLAHRRKAWTEGFTAADWAAAEASRRERFPGDAPIPFEALAAAPFPKLLVRGAWPSELAGSRSWVGAGFAAACAAIAERVGGRLVVFDASTHNPQREEAPAFNRLLREVWAAADADG